MYEVSYPMTIVSFDGFDEMERDVTSLFALNKRGQLKPTCLWPNALVVEALVHNTGIPLDVLLNTNSLRSESISTKMSWMARKYTTRDGDAAYCLLGIFGVNMPLLSGAGRKAFDRLQLELLQSSNHESTFTCYDHSFETRLLAPARSPYTDCGKPVASPTWTNVYRARRVDRTPYSITNTVLSFEISANQGGWCFTDGDSNEGIIAALDCNVPFAHESERCFMTLMRVSCGHYIRKPSRLSQVNSVVLREVLDRMLLGGLGPGTGDQNNGSELIMDSSQAFNIFIHFGLDNHDACGVKEVSFSRRFLIEASQRYLVDSDPDSQADDAMLM